MKKRIVLCADDYGQALPISEAIIHLLQKGRLSAVSCMTNSPFWPNHADWLLPFKTRAAFGLHFNLTEGRPLSPQFRQSYGETFNGLSRLIGRAYLNALKVEVLAAELVAQLEAFVDQMGALPQFIDGHQHVHQLPLVRDALIYVYLSRLQSVQPMVRLINVASWWRDYKKSMIYLLGTPALRRTLLAHGIPFNPSFSGIYDFFSRKKYGAIFPQFLNESKDGGWIMCHPGLRGSSEVDAIAEARHHEYIYFLSDQFVKDMASAKVVLSE